MSLAASISVLHIQYLFSFPDSLFLSLSRNLSPKNSKLGELLLTCSLIALHIYWFWYWADGWTYRPNTIKRSARQAELDKYVRVCRSIEVTEMRPLSYVVMKVSSNLLLFQNNLIIVMILLLHRCWQLNQLCCYRIICF